MRKVSDTWHIIWIQFRVNRLNLEFKINLIFYRIKFGILELDRKCFHWPLVHAVSVRKRSNCNSITPIVHRGLGARRVQRTHGGIHTHRTTRAKIHWRLCAWLRLLVILSGRSEMWLSMMIAAAWCETFRCPTGSDAILAAASCC